MVEDYKEDHQFSTKHKIAQPPLNLLFNPSLIVRDDVWKIDVVKLLEILLSTLTTSKYKDLRLCGVAILTSTLIHRLKVESIFRLEKIANKTHDEDAKNIRQPGEILPIPNISDLSLPFRKELSYPISLEDLLTILENMVTDLTNPIVRKAQVHLEPVEVVNFQDYLIKFERIIEEFEIKLLDTLNIKGEIVFNDLVKDLSSLEAARFFIAMLYLSMKDKIDIITQPSSDVTIENTPQSKENSTNSIGHTVETDYILIIPRAKS